MEVQAIAAEDEVPFREWLVVELRSRRMSLRQLAQRSGVNASTVSRIIRGERRPTLQTAVRLARAVRGATDESTATHYFGSLSQSSDPVATVERALRADGSLGDDEIRDVMSVYLALRHGDDATAGEQGAAEEGVAREPGGREPAGAPPVAAQASRRSGGPRRRVGSRQD